MTASADARLRAAQSVARRHSLYRRLLLLMLLQVVIMAVPWSLHRLGLAGTAVMLLFLVSELGSQLPTATRSKPFGPANRLYRFLGLVGVVAWVSWLLLPVSVNWHVAAR